MATQAVVFRSRLELLTKSFISLVHKKVLGQEFDHCNIDALAFLAAGIDASQYALLNMSSAKRFASADCLRDFVAQCIAPAGLILEFGVFSGYSINRFAAQLPERRIFGFDSFKGLPETWRTGFPQGTFQRAKLPGVRRNVDLVVGWFDQTLPEFVAMHPNEPLALLHVDCDLYSSTRTIFSLLGDRIVPGTIIVFDEYLNYPGWRLHEYKAFQEFTAARAINYTYIGLVPSHEQVAIRIDEVGDLVEPECLEIPSSRANKAPHDSSRSGNKGQCQNDGAELKL